MCVCEETKESEGTRSSVYACVCALERKREGDRERETKKKER